MAYRKQELIDMSIKAIKKHSLKKMTHIPAYLPCDRSTFYNYKLEILDDIKEELYKNKINSKIKLSDKWEDSDNPTLQIAAYKLMADEDELIKLTSSKFDHRSSDGTMTPKTTIITTMTQDQLKESLNK